MMERSVFRFVLRYSMREQIVLLLLTLLAFPFLYLRIMRGALRLRPLPPPRALLFSTP